jgi:glycerol-3-phosphate acyltransferase PlsY
VPGAVMIPVALMASILLVKHAGNLRRLLAGQESKIGRKKSV